MNPVKIKYYPLVISVDKCTGNCNVFLVPKNICSKRDKRHAVKAFNMVTKKIKLNQ